MIIENLTTLKINKLTKAQYEATLAAGKAQVIGTFTDTPEINITYLLHI